MTNPNRTHDVCADCGMDIERRFVKRKNTNDPPRWVRFNIAMGDHQNRHRCRPCVSCDAPLVYRGPETPGWGFFVAAAGTNPDKTLQHRCRQWTRDNFPHLEEIDEYDEITPPAIISARELQIQSLYQDVDKLRNKIRQLEGDDIVV